MQRRRKGTASLADCGVADLGLLAVGGNEKRALVVFGPSLDALEGTEIGEGRRFSKRFSQWNRLNPVPGVTGLKAGVRASRNFV
jgi:hypothetical protein